MSGRYGNIDYARFAKLGFALGVAIFAIGATGEVAGHALYGALPAWEDTLFFDLEVLGIFVTLLSPLVFGVLLPLTE